MAKTWTQFDPRWQTLNPYQRAALMSMMEADGRDLDAARNALGAMVNRAAKSGEDIGAHVSKPIYQPTIEPSQQARIDSLMRDPRFSELTGWAERRSMGLEPDPVGGATHFLAPERTMLSLEAREPNKYKNWGPRGANWTGYDPSTGQYRGVITRDTSHAFLAPDGAYSVEGQKVGLDAAPDGGLPKLALLSETPGAAAVAPTPAPGLGQSPTQVASAAPQVGDDATLSGMLSGLFGKPADTGGGGNIFSSMMSQASASPIPKAEQVQAAPAYPRPVDVASILSIIQQRSKLGTA